MNVVVCHRHLVRTLQALLIVLCAGFFTYSMAADHSPGDEHAGTLLTALASVAESAVALIHPNHQDIESTGSHDHTSVLDDTDHKGHGAHGSTPTSEPCQMPCDGALTCPSVCVLACAPGSLSATTISANMGFPQRRGLFHIPTHGDADAIVELSLSPLFRPPIS